MPDRPIRIPNRFESASLTMPPVRQQTVMARNGIIEKKALALRSRRLTCAI